MRESFGGERKNRSTLGFTLLEVIVALVILSTSGLVLFAWINQNLATATRLRESQARSQLQLEGISWLATINPTAEPEGEREIGGLRLTWQAALIEPMRSEYDYGGSLIPKWSVGLYRIDATVARTDSSLKVQWHQDMAGWTPLVMGSSTNPSPLPARADRRAPP